MDEKPIRVLLAEDEYVIALALRGQLESLGYQVIGTPTDGSSAVAMVQELGPDVVLMDIGLPDLDGIAATEQIMASAPTPVVILSAYTDRQRVEQAKRAGAAGYLFKPALANQIKRAIDQALAPPGTSTG